MPRKPARKITGKPTRKTSRKTSKAATVSSRTIRSWRFVLQSAVEALHMESLAEHGGLAGIRDRGLLDSALNRCKNKAGYKVDSTVYDLAAALAFGIAKNHPFHDGNKRIALIASFLFVELNGVRMTATEADAAASFLALAAGDLSEADLAKWFKANSRVKTIRR
jgi:death on curing protein